MKHADDGISLTCLTSVAMAMGLSGLKLTGAVDWSWVWIWSPIWIVVAALVSVFLIISGWIIGSSLNYRWHQWRGKRG